MSLQSAPEGLASKMDSVHNPNGSEKEHKPRKWQRGIRIEGVTINTVTNTCRF